LGRKHEEWSQENANGAANAEVSDIGKEGFKQSTEQRTAKESRVDDAEKEQYKHF